MGRLVALWCRERAEATIGDNRVKHQNRVASQQRQEWAEMLAASLSSPVRSDGYEAAAPPVSSGWRASMALTSRRYRFRCGSRCTWNSCEWAGKNVEACMAQ